MMKKLLAAIALLWSTVATPQTPAQTASVLMSAVASASPAKITLSWSSFSGTSSFTLSRKTKAQTTWTQIATPASNATSYEDATAVVGTYYEYKLTRTASSGTGYGYIAAGIQVPVVDSRGKMVLLVDNTFSTALSTQLTQLVDDLKGDGWVVLRHDVSPSLNVPSVKALIQADYNADPTNVKAVFIFGHVAQPYSGNLNPDGHGNHIGAWPCDMYYGDMDGTWTDVTVNNTSSSSDGQRNWNVPGDGKWDQSQPPTAIELQVGRVDLSNMESFQYYAGLSDQALLSAYLTKLHNFKIKQFTPQYRGIVFDNFDDVPQPLAASGYRIVSANVGPSNTTIDPTGNGSAYSSYIDEQSYLWGFACGGGQPVSAQNVTSTGELAQSIQNGVIFNMTIGSYFGDWGYQSNFLRAFLCSGNGLTNCYAGLPYWWLHHMGMGDNIGYGTMLSMNGTGSIYTPANSGWQSGTLNRTHMGLMGDPSLRQISVAPPSGLSISNSGGFAAFSWSAAAGSPLGYHVYDLGTGSTLPVRLTSSPVAGTSWSDGSVTFVANRQYMVRAVVLTTSSTGTYYNMSLGAIGTSPATPTILVSPKACLRGPYNSATGLMNDALRTLSAFPLTDPYPSLGYVHTGNGTGTIDSEVLAVTGNNAIVDWVVVELRNNSTPYAVVASKSVLIQRDGDVVDRDGTSAVSFQLNAGTYRVSLRHRNHLGIMSASGVSLGTVTTTVNFTASGTSAYGTNPMDQVVGSFTKWTMKMGDVNFNGQIKYTGTGNDIGPILVAVGSTTPSNVVTSTYALTDVNLDGQVKYTGTGNDRDLILVTVGSLTPNNVVNAQLP